MKTSKGLSIIGLGILLPLLASATSPEELQCQKKIEDLMDQRLQTHRPAVYEMYKRTPDDLCAFNSMAAGIDNSRCKGAVEELHSLLNERKEKRGRRCKETVDYDNFNRRCAGNQAANKCFKEGGHIRKRNADGSKRWRAQQSRLAKAVEKVETEMMQLTEEYKNNLEAIKQDKANGLKTSQAACKVGDCNPTSAYSMLGGDSALSGISQTLDRFKSQNDITPSDIQTAQSLSHGPASEALYLAGTAKSARREMEEDNRREAIVENKDNSNINQINKSESEIASADPQGFGANQAAATSAGAASGMGGLGGASGGSGLNGSGEVKMADGGTFDPNARAGESGYLLNGIESAGGKAATADIDGTAYADASGSEGENNTSASSRSPKIESLKDKLAARLAAGGQAGSVEASQAANGAAGAAEGAKGKADALAKKMTPDMFVGFEATGFDGAGGNFSMAQSETDAAVREMMSEFEGPADNGFGSGRFLASADGGHSAPEILAEDSSDLFHRTKEFYERCQKRGCVTR